jgi:tetratricopeptide (TPR) repeat protein
VQPGSPAAERRRLFEALSVLLRRLSQRAPVLLVLDDLHNAGLGTTEFLHYLARNMDGARLLCLPTVRDEEGAEVLEQLADVATQVSLGPLSADAVVRLAAAAGRRGLADSIHRRTGGHPLFVVETLRGLSAGEPGVPASLQAAILSRVRHAGSDVEEVLRAAAVFGPQFQPHVLAAMLAIPPIAAVRHCERALRLHLVVVAGHTYEFANDLVQEVLYATTPIPTRVQHHRAAIEQLRDQPEAMAEHAAAAGDWLRAARAWLVAGDQALHRFAASDAEVLLGRALDAADRAGDGELQAQAHLMRGRAREALAGYEGAWTDHQAATALARHAGNRRLEMLALRELGGDVPVALGHSAAACMMYLNQGERLAEALGEHASQADLLARLAILASNRLQFDDGVDYGRRAVVVARMSGEDHALAGALDGLKTAYAYLGEIADLEPVLAELLPLLRRRGDLWRLQWATFESAMPALACADWNVAVERIDDAIAVSRDTGYGAYSAWFLAHRGWIERLRGRPDDALQYGRAAVDVASRAHHPWWLAAANAFLATTLLEIGAVTEAVALLEEGLAAADRAEAEAYRLRCLGPLAEATGRLGILAQAADLLERVRTPSGAAWLAGADAYFGVARAWISHDEPARAFSAVAPLLAAAERNNWVVALADACLIAARCALDQHEAARAHQYLARARNLASTYRLQRIERAAARALPT